MVGSNSLFPQIEEEKVLNFERSETAVGFFLDICLEDLKTLIKYYEIAMKNANFMRMQNTMRIRQNDKYLDALEQEIARLESRWVVPLAKATNIFQSATRFTDVPPQDVKPDDEDSGTEITDSEKTDTQDKRLWITEPAVVQLKAVGVKPYKEINKKLRQLRHRRSQYKYLELYFVNLGRQAINLIANLRLILAVTNVVKKFREKLNDDKLANNPLGQIVREIITSNDLDTSVEKLEQLDIDSILEDKGKGGAAGRENSKASSAQTNASGARNDVQTKTNQSTGVRPTTGEVPERSGNGATAGPKGINPRQSTKGPQ